MSLLGSYDPPCLSLYYRDLPHEPGAAATRRLPPKPGQRRSLAKHPFPGISRLSTRKLQAKYTHATKTVTGGRKEEAKAERASEARAMSSFLMRIRRKSWRSTVKDEMKGMRDTAGRYIRLARARSAHVLYLSQYSVCQYSKCCIWATL